MSQPFSILSAQKFLPEETIELLKQYGSNFPHDLALEQDMSILFSDMRGFTELAENYQPREVYATINASLAVQVQCIHAHGGSVNKFLGDGLLACFSGEGKSERALASLLEMLKKLPENEGQLLPCRVGFGLHCGKVLLGVLGNEERWEYTVIGDVANTAARLCGIAQPFQALLTESVIADIPSSQRKSYCSYLHPQMFKGKKHAIDIYQVKSG